ncbi:WD40/YVTN/BNR-like repeat-containing protein [Chloroflexota bacterium]
MLDPDIAYAASEDTVFRSVDGGATWGKMTPKEYGWGPPGELAGIPIDLQADDRDVDRVFANNYAGGNYVSEDGGTTWASASTGYTGATLHSVAVDPANSLRVYAGGRLAPFCSVDGGANWQGLNWRELSGVALTEIAAIAINPQHPDTILISNNFKGVIIRTTDAGRRWDKVYKHPGIPKTEQWIDFGFSSIAFAPSDTNVVYAGLKFTDADIELAPPVSDFGVYKSTDGGRTWGPSQDDLLSTLNVNVVAVHPVDAAIVYAGTVEQGVFWSTDGGQTW